jgi:enolase-phosphatase E1
MLRVAAVVTDIEGTTTPIAFVRDTLFPYARTRLESWLAENSTRPEVVAELEAASRISHGKEPLTALMAWMEQDAKVTPLKAIQGMIWNDGYAAGELRGDVYPDVAPCLRRWVSGGLRLYVYSSGSVDAQKLIFGHSVAGDLTGLFSGFFDTRIGGKREPDSYARLAIAMKVPSAEILFLSDVEEELDAATAAGWRTCQLVRPQDGTAASARHATAADFDEVAGMMGLPHAA